MRRRRARVCAPLLSLASVAAAVASCGSESAARADDASVVRDPNAPTTLPITDGANAVPAPATISYLQYGVAFTAELATAGAFCEDTQLDCILGSGGGIAVRVGWRNAGDWYIGGAYELSKQDPTKLMQLAILQQVRAEARRYFLRGNATQPFVAVAAGLAGYGNEWSISTFGPMGFVGAGLEWQVQNGPIVGVTLGYRPLFLQKFTDATGRDHGPGVAHIFGMELALEAREPL